MVGSLAETDDSRGRRCSDEPGRRPLCQWHAQDEGNSPGISDGHRSFGLAPPSTPTYKFARSAGSRWGRGPNGAARKGARGKPAWGPRARKQERSDARAPDTASVALVESGAPRSLEVEAGAAWERAANGPITERRFSERQEVGSEPVFVSMNHRINQCRGARLSASRSIGACRPAPSPLRIVPQHWRSRSSVIRPPGYRLAYGASSTSACSSMPATAHGASVQVDTADQHRDGHTDAPGPHTCV